MNLKFTKMHGIGNDFVVFDAINQTVDLTAEKVRYIANRRYGVGCDQVLLVGQADEPGVDFAYRIFNADGAEVEQCGNGARCFMQFVHAQGLTDKNQLTVKTRCGIIELYTEANAQVRVNMGVPNFQPAEVPFQADSMAISYPLDVDGQTISVGVVSMGNPHAVLQVENVQTTDIARLGPLIESHSRFPRQVNAGFMQLVSSEHIKLRVYERGAGETLACGSGACAAVAIGRAQELLDEKVTVSLPGGDLIIEWQGMGHPLWMIGSATTVYQGNINL